MDEDIDGVCTSDDYDFAVRSASRSTRRETGRGTIRRMITIVDAEATGRVDEFATLIGEYFAWLGRDLAYQNVDDELATPLGVYGKPRGAMLIAECGAVAGGVGVRPIDTTTGEIKRLWVRDAHRGEGVGRTLIEAACDAAVQIGYDRLVLDTTADLAAANHLYETMGFERIEPYTHNPFPGARYWQKTIG